MRSQLFVLLPIYNMSFSLTAFKIFLALISVVWIWCAYMLFSFMYHILDLLDFFVCFLIYKFTFFTKLGKLCWPLFLKNLFYPVLSSASGTLVIPLKTTWQCLTDQLGCVNFFSIFFLSALEVEQSVKLLSSLTPLLSFFIYYDCIFC